MAEQTAPSIPAAELTLQVTRGVCRAFYELGQATLTEVSLANGRRADVLALDRDGIFSIVEVKVSTADFLGDKKWPEYGDFCDQLYFAVPQDFPLDILPDECGLVLADAYGGDIIRPAPRARLHASRRKALTLKFARLAADRLAQAVATS